MATVSYLTSASNEIYSDAALGYITARKNDIFVVSSTLGISAAAIAGAIAEENTESTLVSSPGVC
ncbi:hypothetical protein HZU75_06580 [Chitinibacter fontanus]|uniref:Uncharacterized protein n=1 Tax=Chitinibacter fontanus TaxID=1737446 RepID=A0A7D5ZDN6_9NEIS|nr:hypothetical protein [Chitinibacter fontanus]QLI81224.1 hypothetical protein HZU75_06580 [Chitinibacter fontanus]